jgi:threonine synthase
MSEAAEDSLDVPLSVGSAAIGQISLASPRYRYPLLPVLSEGCPSGSSPAMQYPLEIEFALDRVDRRSIGRRDTPRARRNVALLPPMLPELDLGEGDTPLIRADDLVGPGKSIAAPLFVKDESQNPTGSHKDRLNRMTVSAAVLSGAPGIVVSSSGNHGVSAAAYAARAGLPCVLITMPEISPAYAAMAHAYGAAAVAVPAEMRWPLMRQIVAELGFHPVSNITPCHTGHPFGPEGYKPISYEIAAELDCAPAAVFVPTGYGELLFGIYKGFAELCALGVTKRIPRMFSVEPAARGPLAAAMKAGTDVGRVEARPTAASSIACTVSSYRGVVALRESKGEALTVSDAALRRAQAAMSRTGLYPELSAAAGLAGLSQVMEDDISFDGPVVVVQTGGGVKDPVALVKPIPAIEPTFSALRTTLAEQYQIEIDRYSNQDRP